MSTLDQIYFEWAHRKGLVTGSHLVSIGFMSLIIATALLNNFGYPAKIALLVCAFVAQVLIHNRMVAIQKKLIEYQAQTQDFE